MPHLVSPRQCSGTGMRLIHDLCQLLMNQLGDLCDNSHFQLVNVSWPQELFFYLRIWFSELSELITGEEMRNGKEKLLECTKAFPTGSFIQHPWGMELCTNQECIV
jgi:hypothetical protein